MGRLGLIADTHDELHYIDLAVGLFCRERCDSVIHAGDVVSAEALRRFAPLADRGTRVFCALGDHDDGTTLECASTEIGAIRLPERIDTMAYELIEGMRVAVIPNPYGGKSQKRPFLLHRLCSDRDALDLVVYGHLHYFNIKYPSTSSPVSVICPGGCRRDVTPRTVAILDSETRELSVFALHEVSGAPLLAFSTSLSLAGTRQVIRGDGLTDGFRRSVRAHLDDVHRAHETFFVASPSSSGRPSSRFALTGNRLEPVVPGHFSDSSLVLFIRQASFVAFVERQPVGTGRAQIRCNIVPNRHRVK